MIVFSLIVGALLILIWLRFVDTDKMAVYLRNIDPLLIVISAMFYITAYIFRSARWKVILDTIENIKFYEVASLFFVGMFINYLFPIHAGELGKSIFLKKMKGTSIAKSLPTILLNKLMDLFPIVFVFVLAPFVPGLQLNATLIVIMSLLFIAFLLFLGILVFSTTHERQVITLLHKILFWLPARFEHAIKDFIERFVTSIAEAKQGKHVLTKMMFFTVLAVLSDGLYFYFAFRAFRYPIFFISAIYGYALMNLTYILPHPPGQIGSNEFFSYMIFSFGLGIEGNLIGAVIAFTHVLTGFLIILVGIASLGVVGISLSDLVTKNEH